MKKHFLKILRNNISNADLNVEASPPPCQPDGAFTNQDLNSDKENKGEKYHTKILDEKSNRSFSESGKIPSSAKVVESETLDLKTRLLRETNLNLSQEDDKVCRRAADDNTLRKCSSKENDRNEACQSTKVEVTKSGIDSEISHFKKDILSRCKPVTNGTKSPTHTFPATNAESSTLFPAFPTPSDVLIVNQQSSILSQKSKMRINEIGQSGQHDITQSYRPSHSLPEVTGSVPSSSNLLTTSMPVVAFPNFEMIAIRDCIYCGALGDVGVFLVSGVLNTLCRSCEIFCSRAPSVEDHVNKKIRESRVAFRSPVVNREPYCDNFTFDCEQRHVGDEMARNHGNQIDGRRSPPQIIGAPHQSFLPQASGNETRRMNEYVSTQKQTPEKTCTNCHTNRTTLWRRGPAGETLCNACQQHWRKTGENRPPSRSTDVIRRRRRKPNNPRA